MLHIRMFLFAFKNVQLTLLGTEFLEVRTKEHCLLRQTKEPWQVPILLSYKPFPAQSQHLKVSQIACHFSQLILRCLDPVELGSINIKRYCMYKLRNCPFKIPCGKRSSTAYLACQSFCLKFINHEKVIIL